MARLHFAGTGEEAASGIRSVGQKVRTRATEKTAGRVACVRGAERNATGRSSDLRLIANLAKPSREQSSQWRRGRETLTEYSSGPVPDSHRLPFSSHRAECATRRLSSDER